MQLSVVPRDLARCLKFKFCHDATTIIRFVGNNIDCCHPTQSTYPPHPSPPRCTPWSAPMTSSFGAASAAADNGQVASLKDLEALLQQSQLPLERVATVVGYGSGVFAQHDDTVDVGAVPLPAATDTPQQNNMVDLIVVVDDAYLFHHANCQVNPHHYSTTARLWSRTAEQPQAQQQQVLHRQATNATWWQRHTVWPDFLSHWFCNPRAYFCVVDKDRHNGTTNVPFRPHKYGVIQADDLISDLTHWTHLYVAGRWHKPTVELPLQPNDATAQWSEQIQSGQANTNLPSALSAALLLLQQSSPEDEEHHGRVASSSLGTNSTASMRTSSASSIAARASTVYQRIAGLSYSGDFRMAVGAEDPRKTSKLVHSAGQMARWDTLYRPAMEVLQREGILSVAPVGSNANAGSIDDSLWTWDTSPHAIAHIASRLPSRFQHLAAHPALLSAALTAVVAPAARYQAIKGLVTGGSLSTTWRYATRKLSKGRWWSSR